MADIKYNIGDKVRTKIHYENDTRTEVEAVIRGIELDDITDVVRYKIHFEPEDHEKGSCTGCNGYVKQDDILELCQQKSQSIYEDMTYKVRIVLVRWIDGNANQVVVEKEIGAANEKQACNFAKNALIDFITEGVIIDTEVVKD